MSDRGKADMVWRDLVSYLLEDDSLKERTASDPDIANPSHAGIPKACMGRQRDSGEP